MPEQPASPVSPAKSANKTILIAFAVIILAILAGSAYYFLGQTKDSASTENLTGNQNPGQNTNSNSNNNNTTTPTKSSIKNLLGSDKNLTCDITYTDGKGRIYVTGEKFYGEFETTIGGKTYDGVVMQDGTHVYVWTSDSKQGIKSKLTLDDKAAQQNGVDFDEEGDLDCENWQVDNSKFTPPADISFIDFDSPTQ